MEGGVLAGMATAAASAGGKKIVSYVADSIRQLMIRPPDQVILQKSVPDINNCKTLQNHLDEILGLLHCHSEKVSDCKEGRTIAICGPPGIGKAAIMKNLNNHKKIPKMFEIVMWIEAKDTDDKIQMEIARRLKLSLEGSYVEIAARISETLEDRKYLLLLNGVKRVIRLQDIGIPDNKNCSKVVLTTESIGVCFEMDPIHIRVQRLTRGEAWQMFKKMVGDTIGLPRVEEVAQQVVNECDGIPLLIKIAANEFKEYKTAGEWETVLAQLRGLSRDIAGLIDYHNFFILCYDQLRCDRKKICFLYGALHPANTKISSDYLVKCWAADGLLNDNSTLRAACNEGIYILRNLKKSSLLEADESMEHVEVTNTVRRVALHISSRDNLRFRIGEATRMNGNEWAEATRIFLIDTGLTTLPDVPTGPDLRSLLLQMNRELREIPPLFFRTMQELRVLSLYSTGITSWPLSSDQLTGLQALFLKDCLSLTELPSEINHHLQVLDIRGCKIIFIPTSIEELTCLRSLRVSYYKPTQTDGHEGQKTGDGKVISRLSKLEELIIDVDMNSYNQWSTEAAGVIDEVANLDNLTSLGIVFPNTEVLTKFMGKRETRRCQPLSFFRCIVGETITDSEILKHLDFSIPRFLRWKYQTCDHDFPITNVIRQTDALELIDHQEITCLSDFIRDSVGEGDQNPGLNKVFGCLVDRCGKMTTVVNGNNAGDFILLEKLQHLHLRDLSRLSSIFEDGRLSKIESLSNLHTIVVEHCGIVKIMISSNSVIQCLPSFKKLTIQSCEKVINLFEITAGEKSMGKLETLELFELKELTSIYRYKSLPWPRLKWPHLKVLRVCNCPKLKRLPFGRKNAPELELIEGEPEWWNALHARKLKKRVSFSPIFMTSGTLGAGPS